MHDVVKKIVAGAAVLVLGYVAYYGTYLPLQKSEVFIATVRGMGTVRSVEEFANRFSVPLGIPSPVGHEELVRNMATEIVGLVGSGGTTPEVKEALTKFVARSFAPMVAYGKGMSFGQDLYILGTLHRMVFQSTNKREYLDAAEQYFLKAFELGPRRPQPLYALLDVYLVKQDAGRVQKLAEQIHAQWPSDTRAISILDAIKGMSASSTKPKK